MPIRKVDAAFHQAPAPAEPATTPPAGRTGATGPTFAPTASPTGAPTMPRPTRLFSGAGAGAGSGTTDGANQADQPGQQHHLALLGVFGTVITAIVTGALWMVSPVAALAVGGGMVAAGTGSAVLWKLRKRNRAGDRQESRNLLRGAGRLGAGLGGAQRRAERAGEPKSSRLRNLFGGGRGRAAGRGGPATSGKGSAGRSGLGRLGSGKRGGAATRSATGAGGGGAGGARRSLRDRLTGGSRRAAKSASGRASTGSASGSRPTGSKAGSARPGRSGLFSRSGRGKGAGTPGSRTGRGPTSSTGTRPTRPSRFGKSTDRAGWRPWRRSGSAPASTRPTSPTRRGASTSPSRPTTGTSATSTNKRPSRFARLFGRRTAAAAAAGAAATRTVRDGVDPLRPRRPWPRRMRHRVRTAGEAATSGNAKNAGSNERGRRRNRGAEGTERPKPRTKAQRFADRKAQADNAVDDGGFPSPPPNQPRTKRQKTESVPVDDGGFPSPPRTPSSNPPKPAPQPQAQRPGKAAPTPAEEKRAFERENPWLKDVRGESNYVVYDNAGNVLYDHSRNNSDLVHKGSVIDSDSFDSNGSSKSSASNPAGGQHNNGTTVRSDGMTTTSAEQDASTSSTQTQAWDEAEQTARTSAARFDGEARQAREEAGRLAHRPDMAEACARLHREASAAEQTADHRRGMASGYAAIRAAVFGQRS